MVKNLPAMQETCVQSLRQEDSPEEGNGNSLQYSCLENPTDRGAWWATVHGVMLSYCFILSAVMHLQSGDASTKALSTCGSHLILILFFYTLLLVFIFTNKAGKKVSPEVPILLNVLHHLIPPALNPIVYGVRTQEIKQGIIKLFKYQC